jgi:hypothetical protein
MKTQISKMTCKLFFLFLAWIWFLSKCNGYLLNEHDLSEVLSVKDEENRFLVVIVERLGLGNRLRTLADWYVISLLSNRKLIVSWKPSIECNISFADLFDEVPKNVFVFNNPVSSPTSSRLFRSASAEAVISLRNSLTFKGLSSYYLSLSTGEDGEEKGPQTRREWVDEKLGFLLQKESIISPEYNVIITHYDGEIALEDVSCQYYSIKHSSFLSSLKPKSEFSEIVSQIMENYFNGFLPIGIHMRINDPFYDWAVIPPRDGTPNQAREFGDGASVIDFAKAMKEIETFFSYKNYHNETISLAKFFIASNNEIEKSKLLDLFPDAVTIASSNLSRNSIEGMKLAFIEWLILSSTSLIINTYGSSFAVEASYRSTNPIIGIFDTFLVHHDHSNLPHCGVMQFAKYYSKHAEPVTFVEGTTDNRKVSICLFHLSGSVLMLFSLFCFRF